MDRSEFEALREHGNKRIEHEIKFRRNRSVLPVLSAEDIPIGNDQNADLRLSIRYNTETDAATFNVHVPGVGPICRLDVGGPAHRPAGRSHKHSLQTERCPQRNLPDHVVDRPDLLGEPLPRLFEEFCRMADIAHTAGALEDPSGSTADA